MTERRFGEIVSKTVLYRGENFETNNGILYRNVENYLNDLKREFSFKPVQEEDISEQEDMTIQGGMTMI